MREVTINVGVAGWNRDIERRLMTPELVAAFHQALQPPDDDRGAAAEIKSLLSDVLLDEHEQADRELSRARERFDEVADAVASKRQVSGCWRPVLSVGSTLSPDEASALISQIQARVRAEDAE